MAENEIINIGVGRFFEPFGIIRNENMDFKSFDSAEEIFSRLLSGDLDLGYIPSECLEKLSRSEQLSSAVVSLETWRNEGFFLVSRTDARVKFDKNDISFDDIRRGGEKILCFNFSISSYYRALESVLDLLDFSLGNDEIIPALVSGAFSYAVLPVEYAELAVRKSEFLEKALELDASHGFDFPRIVLAANGRFYKTHFDYIQTITNQGEKL